jgi:hypothetical protein
MMMSSLVFHHDQQGPLVCPACAASAASRCLHTTMSPPKILPLGSLQQQQHSASHTRPTQYDDNPPPQTCHAQHPPATPIAHPRSNRESVLMMLSSFQGPQQEHGLLVCPASAALALCHCLHSTLSLLVGSCNADKDPALHNRTMIHHTNAAQAMKNPAQPRHRTTQHSTALAR